MLVDIGPVLREVAHDHKVRARDLRDGNCPADPRWDAAQRFADAGMSGYAVSKLLGLDHAAVRSRVRLTEGRGRKARPGSLCVGHGEVLPLDAFNDEARKASGVKSNCRECCRVALARARAGQAAYRRRPHGRPRARLSVDLAPELKEIMTDVAARHRTTYAAIVERALAKALACTNCHKRLREVGSDECSACIRIWTPRAVAS